jgi:NADPH:quinone reductase-like Zn-dependent oxidoreductase
VLVRVRAAGLNFHDNRMRLGLTSAPPSRIPGLEMAGDVAALGLGVTEWKVGDRVFGRAREAYAEYVAVEADSLFPMPERMDYHFAGVVPVAFLTATHALLVKAPIMPGDKVLVQAGGSSVGSAAIQIAKRAGAWVVATAGTDERAERTQTALGADASINYSTQDVPARVKELTGGAGVDLVVDGLGSATFQASLSSLGQDGRLLLYGAASGGDSFTADVGSLAYKGLSITGFAITTESALFAKTMECFRSEILPALGRGELRAVLEQTLPLREAYEAHRSILIRRHFGKIALLPDDPA